MQLQSKSSIIVDTLFIDKCIHWLRRGMIIILRDDVAVCFLSLRNNLLWLESISDVSHRNYGYKLVSEVPLFSHIEDIAKKILSVVEYPDNQVDATICELILFVCLSGDELNKVDNYYWLNFQADHDTPF
jgi:hypothetical protein